MKKLFTIGFALLISQFNAQTVFYSKSTGALGTLATWGTNTNGTGTAPVAADFTDGTTHTFVIANRTAGADRQHSTVWNLASAKLVVVGDGTAAMTFTIGGSPTGAINSASISTANNSTLAISNNVGVSTSTFVTLDANSWIFFSNNGASVLPANYQNLGISGAGNGTISLAGSTSVDGTLSIVNTRTLNVGANSLFLKGFIISNTSGAILTSSLSSIFFGAGGFGSGAIGTLRLAGTTPTLGVLDINFTSSSSTVTLGSSIIFFGAPSYFGLYSGSVDLNTRTLTIDASSDITFQSFSGQGGILSTSGSIIINGTIGQNFGGFSLFMDGNSNTLKSLVLNSAGFQLDIGSNLKISDHLTITDGEILTNNTVTLTATSSGSARLGVVGTTGVVTGDLSVESFIPGGTTGWANLSTPGVDSQIFATWDTWAPNGNTYGIPMICTGCFYTPSSFSNFHSIQNWNEPSSSYQTNLSASSAITPGKGYWVYVGDGASTTNDLKLLNTGPAVVGDQVVALTRTGAAPTASDRGYNLIANPYASAISWSSVFGANSNINDAIYMWNANANDYGSFVGGTPANGGTNVVARGQGFYVEATASTSFTFTEADKITGGSLLKPGNIGQILRLNLAGATSQNEMVLRLHANATNQFDKEWDARKILKSAGYQGYIGPYTKYTTLSSKDQDGNDYSIHSIPLLTQSVSIPLLARVESTGSYTIEATDYKDISDCVYLKDKLLDKIHDLKSGSYVFTINDTTSVPRFELLLCKDQVDETGIKGLSVSNNVWINQDVNGAYVKTQFAQNTKATISAYNIVGQKLMDDVKIEGTETTTKLNLNVQNQVVLIKVTTDRESFAKKIVLH